MNRTQAKETIKEFLLRRKVSSLALLLDGAWGTGKTHLIKEVIDECGSSNQKVAYLSLFPLKTIDALKIELALATFSITKKSWLPTAVDKIGSWIAKLGGYYAIADLAGLAVQLVLKNRRINNQCIVFDDYERTEIAPVEILGFINELIEHQDNRVVLVGNSAELRVPSREEYMRHHSKVIGDVIIYSGDIEPVIRQHANEHQSKDGLCPLPS